MTDVSTRVKQYLQLRGMLETMDSEHRKKRKGITDVMEMLEGVLQKHLSDTGVTSAKTPAGTFFRATRYTATVADGQAFLDHIRTEGLWELLERRCNPTAARDYTEEHGAPPPGVNLNTIVRVNVRSPTEKGDKNDD